MILKVYPLSDFNSQVYLRLEEFGGGIVLRACDNKGELLPMGKILEIGSKGITRANNVSHALGLTLDDHGRVDVTN